MVEHISLIMGSCGSVGRADHLPVLRLVVRQPSPLLCVNGWIERFEHWKSSAEDKPTHHLPVSTPLTCFSLCRRNEWESRKRESVGEIWDCPGNINYWLWRESRSHREEKFCGGGLTHCLDTHPSTVCLSPDFSLLYSFPHYHLKITT